MLFAKLAVTNEAEVQTVWSKYEYLCRGKTVARRLYLSESFLFQNGSVVGEDGVSSQPSSTCNT